MILKAVNRQLRQKVIFITKLVLVLSVVLVNQGCSWQARKEPVKTEVVQEPSLSVTTISEEVFRDDDYITEIPIRWSRDSADLYYIAYQSDESVPLEIWKFDGKKKEKVAQLDYREEYINYHLGAFIKRSSWSPSNDMLGFILEIGWGTFYQMVVLDIKTGKIELIDNIYDFDWYPQENKLVLVKQAEPSSLKTTAMVYDPENNQSKELSEAPKNITGVAFDNSGNLYVAEVESKKAFRIDLKGNKQYVEPGEPFLPSWDRTSITTVSKSTYDMMLLPSLDRTRIVLISYSDEGKTIVLHDIEKQETGEILQGDVKKVYWGNGNTLQLVMLDKIHFVVGGDFKTVEARSPSAPSPDNRKFLVETEDYSVDLVAID